MADTPELSPPNKRPVFRNIHVTDLRHYRLPISGKLSILHRISGVLLFLALPVVLLPLFGLSITSELSFEKFQVMVNQWWVKLILLVLLWSYLHHFFAGIRYLLLDMHMGIDKARASRSALVVFILSLGLTLVLGLKLFGVF